MDDELFYFHGKRVRIYGDSENPEFLAVDVIDILYPEIDPDTRTTYLRGIPEKWKGLQKVQTLGGLQNMVTLFEPGLYRLATRSNSPIAISFQEWLFEEVLPSIRKKGYYGKPKHGSYWYERIKLAMSDPNRPLRSGYFSIYSEMMNFFLLLEQRLNYIFPDISIQTERRMIPDISIGLRFNEFLRSEDDWAKAKRLEYLRFEDSLDFRLSGKDNHQIEYYHHVYPTSSHGDNNIQPSNSYPNKYLSIFRYYLEFVWIPSYFPEYLNERDSQGGLKLQEAISKLPSSERQVLKQTILRGVIENFLPEGK